MEAIDLSKTAVGILRKCVPLLHEKVQVLVHVGFEQRDVLRGECVGDRLALSGMLSSVPCVEETSLDGDEGIVEVAVGVSR